MDWLRTLPKVDLHCHLIGTIRPSTWHDLARKHGVRLSQDPRHIYRHINSSPPHDSAYDHTAVPIPPQPPDRAPRYSLLDVSSEIAALLRDVEDFERVAFEAVEDAYRSSKVRHLELHVEVGAYLGNGIGYRVVLGGLEAGLAEAERQFGTSSRLIAGIDRSQSVAQAALVLDAVLANPSPRMVGIGLDNLETLGPAARFAEAYQRARAAGLRTTAHAGEHVPSAANVRDCLDLLRCDRLDHGYFALEDPGLVARCRDMGVPFTCIFTTSRRSWRPWRRESIKRMLHEGLFVTLASDDPAMFPTTLTEEYAIAADACDLRPDQLAELSLRAVEASFLDDGERRTLRAAMRREIDHLLTRQQPRQSDQTRAPSTDQDGDR